MSQYDEMEEKYSDITEFPVRVDVTFRYGLAQSGKASGGAIEETQFKVDKIPFEIDLSKFQEVIPREGFTIILKATEWDKDNGYTFSFKPDASGSYAFAETCVAGTLTYEASGDPVADIHWGMGKTYDFYKQVFNRNSYDDKGSAIYNFVYLPEDENFYPVACPLNNATALSAHKPYPMVYGFGWMGRYWRLYLLTDSGKGTNDNNYSYEVTGVGIEKSRQIAYRTLTTYATKTSQYADIRKASIQAIHQGKKVIKH